MVSSRKKAILFLVCYLAYTSIYIARLNLTAANPVLVPDLLSNTQFGTLGSVFSVVYACGRLFNGMLADRIRPAFLISGGLLLTGVSNVLVSFLPPFVGILFLWGMNAFAQSMLWSSVLRIISETNEPSKAKKLTSFMVTSVATGNVIGILLNTRIVSDFGASAAFLYPGILTLVFSVAVLFTAGKVATETVEKEAHRSLFSLFREKEIRTILPPVLFHGVMKDNISLWMTAYFVASFGINLKDSAWYVVFIPLVGLGGRLIYPLCLRITGEREHLVSVWGFVVCLVASFGLCFAPNAVLAAVFLSIIYASVSVINTTVLSVYPLRFKASGNVASVSGMMDFFTYLGAGVSGWLYGLLIDGYGKYTPMFISWAVLSAISIALMIRFRAKYDRVTTV